MNEISARFVQGLLIGVGIFISVVTLMGLFWVFWVLPDDNEDSYESWKEYSNESNLIISNSRRVIRDNKLVILGALENGGEDSWYDITIETIVMPNTTENFKMGCSNCKDIEHKSIHSHKARIIAADYHLLEENDDK